MKILITCPPMLASGDRLTELLDSRRVEAIRPDVVQTLSEDELMELVPGVDGWIIGDDPATEQVFRAGRDGSLRAAVKWGVGTDNVNFRACEELGISITNTPGAFGNEVADVALGYVIGLARRLFEIDREVRQGHWFKPQGVSLAGQVAGIVGYGDIGRNVTSRLRACGMDVVVYDPHQNVDAEGVRQAVWPDCVSDVDFLVFTCALNDSTYHMLDGPVLAETKPGVKIVNVARGPLIDEGSLVEALRTGHVKSVALDVFESEPLPASSYLLEHPACVVGSHNASNTRQAVDRTNKHALDLLLAFLDWPH